MGRTVGGTLHRFEGVPAPPRWGGRHPGLSATCAPAEIGGGTGAGQLRTSASTSPVNTTLCTEWTAMPSQALP